MDKDVLANLLKRFPMKVLPNGNIRTCPVRISFPHLVKPRQNDQGEDKYEVSLLFPKGADLTVLNKAIESKAIEVHGPNAMAMVASSKISWPLTDQGKKTKDDGVTLYVGYEAGAKTCTAKSSNKPRFVDGNAQEVSADKLYGGCWALVTIHPYGGTFEKVKKYMSIGLNNLQFIADDDRFGGGASDPSDEFEPIDGTAPSGLTNGSGKATADPYDFG